MNALSVSKAVSIVGKGIRDNSSTILTGISVAGLATTVILAVKATPKAMLLLEEYDEHLGYKTISDPIVAVKVAWKPYIPAAIMGVFTIGCIIGANSINLRRNAALASVYSITEATLREYQAKVIETIGEKKEKAIRDEVDKDIIARNPASNREIIITGTGDTMCFDVLSGRYFMSNMEFLRKVQNDVNQELINSMWVDLNEVYDKLGLKSIAIGDKLGWNSEKMLDFKFSSQLSEDGRPVLVLGHVRPPFPTFR